MLCWLSGPGIQSGMSESFTICGIKPTAEMGNQIFGIRIGHCRDGRGPQSAPSTLGQSNRRFVYRRLTQWAYGRASW